MKTIALPIFLSLTTLLGTMMAPARAAESTVQMIPQAPIYVCINSNGTREYSNMGQNAGCKVVDIQGIPKVSVPDKKPVVPVASVTRPASPTRPADFPKIDSHTQKARDTDRMEILKDEIKAEEKKLAALKEEFNNGEPERRGDERNYAKYQDRTASLKESVSRSQKNIEALKREISNLK